MRHLTPALPSPVPMPASAPHPVVWFIGLRLCAVPFLVIAMLASGSAQAGGSFPPGPDIPVPNASNATTLSEADKADANGDYDDALKSRETLIKITQDPAMRDQVAQAWAYYGEGRDLGLMKRWAEGSDKEKRAVELFDQLHYSVGKFQALLQLGGLLRLQQNDREADAAFQQAAELLRTENKWPGRMVGAALNQSPLFGFLESRWEQEYLKGVIVLCDKYAHSPSSEKAYAANMLGSIQLREAGYDDAAQSFRIARELELKILDLQAPATKELDAQRKSAEQAGDSVRLGQIAAQQQSLQSGISNSADGALMALNGLLAIDIYRGNVPAAQSKITLAESEIQKYRLNSPIVGNTLFLKGSLAIFTGDFQAAGASLRQGLTGSTQAQQFDAMTYMLIGLSRLSLAMLNPTSAADYLRVTGQFTEYGNPQTDDCERELWGLIAAFDGRRNEAAGYFNGVIKDYRKYSWKLDLARALRERVQAGINHDPAQDKTDLAEAKAILAQIAPNSFEAIAVQENEADLVYGQLDYKKAEQLHRAALASQTALAPHTIQVAVMRMNIALCLYHQSDAAKDAATRKSLLAEGNQFTAEGWKQARALEPEFFGDESSQAYARLLANYATDYAEVQIANGDNVGAFATLESSRALGLAQLSADRGKLGAESWARHKYFVAQKHKMEADLVAAMNRRAAAGEALARLDKSHTTEGDKLEDAYDNANDQVANASMVYVTFLAAYDEFWSDLQQQLSTNAQTPAADLGHLNVDEVIGAIPRGTTFVMYAVGRRNHAIVLALRGGSSEVLSSIIDLGGNSSAPTPGKNPADLYLLTRKFIDRVQSEPQPEDLDQQIATIAKLANQLFLILFPNKIGEAALGSDHLIISPDSLLWQLPFAAFSIPDNNGATYLGLKKPITYAQSVRLFEAALKTAGTATPIADGSALVVGDPAFGITPAVSAAGQPRGGEVATYFEPDQLWAGLYTRESPPPELKAARQEAIDVACDLRTKPVLDTAATEEEVRKNIDNADVIHFATHAKLVWDLPMSSGLALTPPADESNLESDNDGALQGWEIFSQLQLKARMVVLSACETARGSDVRGEGVIGLTRAFQYAGAASVVATLWTINDRSTSAFMRDFYGQLIDGRPKDDALRDAMQSVAGDQDPHAPTYWKHPHYWAAFTLIGDPSPLKFASASKPQCQ